MDDLGLAVGVGAVAATLATGMTWWQVPRTVKVVLTGSLTGGATGKDVILTLCGMYNQGEVLNAAVEFGGGTQSQVFPIIDEKVRANTEETLERSQRDGNLPREAATQMARERLAAAMQYRRFL